MGMLRHVDLLRPRGIGALIRSFFKTGINLGVIITSSDKLYPGRTAIITEEKEITYQELYQRSVVLAYHLRNHYAIHKNKRVAIACYNHSEHIYAIFGAALAGANIYLLNPEMGQEDLYEFLAVQRFDLFVCERQPSCLPDRYNGKILPVQSYGSVCLTDYLSKPFDKKYRLPRCNSGRIAVLTSGSSGKPKTASRTASYTAFFLPFIYLVKQLQLYRYESLYPATPLYHGFGLAAILVALLLGKRIYLQEKFDAKHACRIINHYQIEVITVVPSMIRRILELPDTRLQSLRCIISGGAMLHASIVEKASGHLSGNYMYNLYGTSEAGVCMIASPAALEYAPETIGKPLSGVQVKIINKEEKEVSTEEAGELCIKCTWSVQPDKWIRTGDLAYKDKNGYYFLKGRKDDMIVSGGENVYPYHLENLLLKHPAVSEVVVIGVDDPDFGQRLNAFIVPNDSSLNEFVLRSWLANRCARYQMPRDIIFLPSIPYMANGKINLSRLYATSKKITIDRPTHSEI